MKKRKITLPRVFHPPGGAPPETLAYLSPAEHEMIRQLTDGTASRGPKGIRSYAVTSGTTTSNTYSSSSGGSGGPGGGVLSAPNRTAPSTGGGGGRDSSPSSGAAKAASGGSGVTGSKGGGASTQQPGAGGNAGQVSAAGLSQAKSALSDTRNTAIGKVAQAAQNTAAKSSGGNYSSATAGSRYGGASTQRPGIGTSGSGTSTSFGGSQYSPGSMYSDPNRSGSALRSVVNGINIAGGTNAQKTDAMLRNMGYSNPVGRAGMLGTFGHESAFDPNAIGDRNLVNHAYGLAQWRGDRWANAQSFAADRGLPTNDIATQAAFAGTELPNRYSSAFRGVQNATTVPDAVAAMNGYERPGGWRPGGDPTKVSGWDDRVRQAQNAYGMPTSTALASAATSAAGEAARIAKRDQALSVLTGGTPNYSMGTEVQGPTRYSANLPGIPSPVSTAFSPSYPAGTYTSPYDRMNPKVMTDPRVGMPTGAFPAGRAFSVGPWQGPRLPNDPTVPRSIPSPMLQTQVMTDPRVSMPRGGYPMGSRVPMDPRVGMPTGAYPIQSQAMTDPRVSRTPLGGFPMAPKIATDPRVSQAPVGGYPAAPPASVFTDPRVGLTPLGSLPAAKPKQPQLAWNVPPLGGALPPEKATALGVWSTNRTPPGPAASPGTIHSQTATAAPTTSETAPSIWQGASGGLTGLIKAKTGIDVNQVATAAKAATQQAAVGQKWVADHPVLAKIAAAVMGGSGPSSGGLRAGMQDHGSSRDDPFYAPAAPPPAPVQQASAPSLDQLQALQASMMQQGASPEDLAYIQSLIDQLSQTQVA